MTSTRHRLGERAFGRAGHCGPLSGRNANRVFLDVCVRRVHEHAIDFVEMRIYPLGGVAVGIVDDDVLDVAFVKLVPFLATATLKSRSSKFSRLAFSTWRDSMTSASCCFMLSTSKIDWADAAPAKMTILARMDSAIVFMMFPHSKNPPQGVGQGGYESPAMSDAGRSLGCTQMASIGVGSCTKTGITVISGLPQADCVSYRSRPSSRALVTAWVRFFVSNF